ncbi:MAG: carbon storage regulator CsrA [Spirochaetia bacterium]
MLILSRKKDERILINENIEISIIDIKGDQVRLGISAPQDVKIFRHEVYFNTQKENEAAAISGKKVLPDLDFLNTIEKDK